MSWVWEFFNWLVILPIVAVMIGMRWLRPNQLVWTLAWFFGLWGILRYGFAIPIPKSVLNLFLGIIGAAAFAYATSSKERFDDTWRPVVRLCTEPRLRLLLIAIVVAIPALAGFNVYRGMNQPLEAPNFPRTVHPASPDSITVHDAEVDIRSGSNPLRHLETDDPEAFARHVANGRDIYYRNCHYCHGDIMIGNGHFAHGLNPIPTNFQDAGTIAQFTESFIFWRVAKGAPGMPPEGGPWDSAMPAWENFLTEEQMWEVVLFLYDFTDQRPRAQEEHH